MNPQRCTDKNSGLNGSWVPARPPTLSLLPFLFPIDASQITPQHATHCTGDSFSVECLPLLSSPGAFIKTPSCTSFSLSLTQPTQTNEVSSSEQSLIIAPCVLFCKHFIGMLPPLPRDKFFEQMTSFLPYPFISSFFHLLRTEHGANSVLRLGRQR